MEEEIKHVSDTALWVAAYRAMESERTDALFNDRLAKKLAGERGMKMAETSKLRKIMAFYMAMRTIAIDRLVDKAISNGVDTVINLGAGLDTRPYRMKLPAKLRWIEVDFPKMIDYKNEILANEKPVCSLQRIACDLSQVSERDALFAQLGNKTEKALVITEGVVAYLDNEQASVLSKSIHAVPSFHYWIQDYKQGNAPTQNKELAKKLKNAPLQFNIEEPLEFFGRDGWKVVENIYMIHEAYRVHRKPPFMFPWSLVYPFMPKKMREAAVKSYGYVMFER